MSNIIKLYDRSRVETDWDCSRRRFWEYEYEGKGIVSEDLSLNLFIGTVVHEALKNIALQSQLATGVDIDGIATVAKKTMLETLLPKVEGEIAAEEFAKEQASLVEGLVRGFYKHAWPNLLARWPKILAVEEEVLFHHDGLTFMSRPDIILSDGTANVYCEYKTTGSKDEGWTAQFATAVQIHSSIKAIEETLGIKIDQVVVQELYKGFQSYGKMSSPFCYAYKKSGNPPFTEEDFLYEYKAGYKRYPVWELEGGIKNWVDKMPETVLAEQFPQTPPIFVKDYLVEQFFKQRAWREKEIDLANTMMEVADDAARAEIMNVTFPQKFSACKRNRMDPCRYLKFCHGVVADPFSEGYTWREPNHQLEKEQQAAMKGETPDV